MTEISPGLKKVMERRAEEVAASTQVLYRNVLLVGGEDSDNTWIRTTLSKKLFKLGLLVRFVWSGDTEGINKERPIPPGTDLIILLIDWMGHGTADSVITAAKKQNVRYVRGRRKFSQLIGILLEHKIINQKDIDASATAEELDVPKTSALPEPPSTLVGPGLVGDHDPSDRSIRDPTLEMPAPEPPPQLEASWNASGKPLDDLLRVFRNVVGELLTAHDVENIKVDNGGHITMDVRKTIDLNDILK